MMSRFKVCPVCKAKCPPNLIECDCGHDLTHVRIQSDQNDEKKESTDTAPEPPKETVLPERDNEDVMVRICEECGTHNPVNVSVCVKCGSELFGMPVPESDSPSEEKPTAAVDTSATGFELVSVDGTYSFTVPEGKTIVGAKHAMGDYLWGKEYVHGTQASFYLENGKLYITDLTEGKNPTFINNLEVPGPKTELHDGDEIGFAGIVIGGKRQSGAAYFLVKKKSCM